MNILAILVSALACFVVGFIFHMPPLGNIWMRLAKITPTGNEKLSNMAGEMFWNYIMNILGATVLSGAILIAESSSLLGSMTWYKGALIGISLWLGFAVVWSSMDVIWMKKSFKLWLFDSISAGVSIAVMGIILAVWR